MARIKLSKVKIDTPKDGRYKLYPLRDTMIPIKRFAKDRRNYYELLIFKTQKEAMAFVKQFQGWHTEPVEEFGALFLPFSTLKRGADPNKPKPEDFCKLNGYIVVSKKYLCWEFVAHEVVHLCFDFAFRIGMDGKKIFEGKWSRRKDSIPEQEDFCSLFSNTLNQVLKAITKYQKDERPNIKRTRIH